MNYVHMCSGLWHCVIWQMDTKVSEEHTASSSFVPWSCRQQVPPKHYCPPDKRHSGIIQKITTWMLAAVKTSDLVSQYITYYTVLILIWLQHKTIHNIHNYCKHSIEPNKINRSLKAGMSNSLLHKGHGEVTCFGQAKIFPYLISDWGY